MEILAYKPAKTVIRIISKLLGAACSRVPSNGKIKIIKVFEHLYISCSRYAPD
jgi:hypothetical protein